LLALFDERLLQLERVSVVDASEAFYIHCSSATRGRCFYIHDSSKFSSRSFREARKRPASAPSMSR
jgi:hypothetical protein